METSDRPGHPGHRDPGDRPDRPDATEAELAVLERLWEVGDARVRDLADHLYPHGGTSAVATVQKLLDRLASKSLVRRRRDGRSYVYRPGVERRELVVHRLRTAAEELCGGSVGSLLTHLVEGGGLRPGELRELRRLVDETDPEVER